MKTTATYTVFRFEQKQMQATTEQLVVEESLLIYVNSRPFTLTMRSPGDEQALTIGLLFTEKILDNNIPYEYHPVEQRNGIITAVNVQIEKQYLRPELLDKRNLLSVSSCGICGKTELNDQLDCQTPLQTSEQLSITALMSMFQEMKVQQAVFNSTSGCHAAAIFDNAASLLSIKEDIGRHNAVDKAIGELIIGGNSKNALILLVSGRVSYEIITKAFIAGIPFLAAISAPSSLAVDLAEDLGITLLGFCREQRATCYTHCERITN